MIILKYLTYIIALLFIILGIALLTGYFMSQGIPTQFRVMVGIVLVLYGAFRFVVTFFKKNESSEI